MDLGLSTSPNQFPDLAYSIRVWTLSVKMFHPIQLLSDILPVSGLYVALLHHGVMKGGVNLLMSQKPLRLFDRQTVDADGSLDLVNDMIILASFLYCMLI